MIQTLYTIQEEKEKGPSTPIAMYLLGVVLMGAIVFFGGEIIKNFDNLKDKSAVTIDSLNQPADVYINDTKVGTTPYESKKMTPGENKITLKTETQVYETKINFIPNTKDTIYNVGIFRDMGISNIFSSGQEFWYEKSGNNSVKIISDPAGASVMIDGSEVGKTPFTSSSLATGSYDLEIVQEGFEKQTARINVEKGNTLNVNLKLFPLPLPYNINKLAEANNLYIILTNNSMILANTQVWVDALVYWNKTRGISIDKSGPNKEAVFDYFIDYKGNIFNQEGKITTIDQLNKAGKGAYLGNAADEEILSAEAKVSYLRVTNQAVVQGKTVTIKDTGLGWLRVRSGPSVDSTEVKKVNIGETFTMLDEQNGWIKIQLDATTTAWAIKDYLIIN